MVKLKDIAAELGLSVSTVSKALNRSSEISEATVSLVWEKAAEMGYFSRRLVDRRTRLVGVLLPEVRSHYYAEMMHVLSRELSREDCLMVTILTNQYAEAVQPCLARLSQYDLDGIIVCCDHGFTSENYRALAAGPVPAVLLAGNGPCILDMVRLEGGMRETMDHLVGLGHRRIGYLGEENTESLYHSLWNLLPEYGLELVPGWMKQGRERFETGGYLRARELLREKELPTAVIAGYDQMAYGAMRAFAEAGLRVPEDISVVGNSSALPDEACPMSLTTIMKPVEQMCVQAVRILRDAMENPKTHIIQSVTFRSKLVIRNSTCPPVQR